MKAFAALFQALDATTSQSAKLAALVAYLRAASPDDAAWATYFLAGGKPRQLVPTKRLKALAQEAAGLPEWLFEESYQAVGDLAETLALLLPPPTQAAERTLAEWMAQLLPLRTLPSEDADARLRTQWAGLAVEQRFVYFKLITGNFRVGVSRLQVTQALASVSGLDAKRIAHRLMGYTQVSRQPQAAAYSALIAPLDSNSEGVDASMAGQPYPFFLAHPFSQPVSDMPALLGPPTDWVVEWKWDGIRAQIVRRVGSAWVWSRGEELVTDRFPELATAALAALPEGTVVDGEILVWLPGEPLPRAFADLQKRLGRKTLGAKLLRELPVVLVAYDLLEHAGHDVRSEPQQVRRTLLEALFAAVAAPVAAGQEAHPTLRLSPTLQGDNWTTLAHQRDAARSMGTEGFMLKNREAQYGVGRTKDVGVWWKWKIDPMSVDAVLIYAQRGHGRRASLYSDYTFAVWTGPQGDHDRQLVPFAKAYSGLTDAEIAKVDAIIRKTTRESFGPVRSVEATLVFELGFEGIGKSPRHKSGIAVRFPRMLRWRLDKTVAEADTLQTLIALLPGESGA